MLQYMSGGGAYGNVSIGAAAAVIKAAKSTRRYIYIYNAHASQTLYLGFDSSVTTSNGLPVAAGQSIKLEGYIGVIYGIGSGAATDTRYLEVG